MDYKTISGDMTDACTMAEKWLKNGKDVKVQTLFQYIKNNEGRLSNSEIVDTARDLGLISSESTSSTNVVELLSAVSITVAIMQTGETEQITGASSMFSLCRGFFEMVQRTSASFWDDVVTNTSSTSTMDKIISTTDNSLKKILSSTKVSDFVDAVFLLKATGDAVNASKQLEAVDKDKPTEYADALANAGSSYLNLISEIAGLIPMIGVTYGGIISLLSEMTEVTVKKLQSHYTKLQGILDAALMEDPSYKPWVEETHELAKLNQYYIKMGIDDEIGIKLFGSSNGLESMLKSQMHTLFPDKGSSWIDRMLSDPESILGLFEQASTTPACGDPLVLDLAGTGFTLSDLDNGAYFDFDGDGFAHRTNWIKDMSAFLALDKDEDGLIENGNELFGNHTIMKNGLTAVNGFQALADMDSNQDGVIDEQDECFGKLKVWLDQNGDGISDDGEVYGLDHFGIVKIYLNAEASGETHSSGAVIDWIASFEFADGRTSQIAEFTLNQRWYDTKEVDRYELSDDILGLPDIPAFGKMHSLQSAVYLDQSNQLKSMVNSFLNATEIEQKKQLCQDILYFISGANFVDSDSRGTNVDAKKLRVIESYLGMDFNGRDGVNPNAAAGVILENSFNKILQQYYIELTARSTISTYANMLDLAEKNGNAAEAMTEINNLISVSIMLGDIDKSSLYDLSLYFSYYSEQTGQAEVFEQFRNYFNTYGYDEIVNYGTYGAIFGKEGNEQFRGTSVRDVIFAGGGNDSLNGGAGNDELYGENGDDTLYGEVGNDLLDGGEGNDRLFGGAGNDVYIFGRGYGTDTISDSEGNNRIRFKEGITAEDLELRKNGNDAELWMKGSDDKIIIKGYFHSEDNQNIQLEFSDGSIGDMPRVIYGSEETDYIYINSVKIGEKGMTAYGNGGNDTIHGGKGSDVLYGGEGRDEIRGGAGDDYLYGEEGDDTLLGEEGDDYLDGGEGDDYLDGGAGNDIYIFGRGCGTDTIKDEAGENKIRFKEGIKAEDLKFIKRDSDAELCIKGSEDKIILKNYFGVDRYRNYQLEFSDGTITTLPREVYGSEGDDNIYVGSTAMAKEGMTVYGEGGNDSLTGDEGNDILYGGSGEDTLYGEKGNDVLYGEEGNDKLYGGAGDDLLDGGVGDDKLYGGEGNDIYIFGRGYGIDTIEDEAGENKIRFKEGIKAEDLKFIKVGFDAELCIKGSEDKIILKNYFGVDRYRNYQLEFSDGKIGILDNTEMLIRVQEQVNENYVEAMPMMLNNLSNLSSYNKSLYIDSEYTINNSKRFSDSFIREQKIKGSDSFSEDLQTKLLIENMVAFGESNNVMDTVKPVTENITPLQTDQLIIQK